MQNHESLHQHAEVETRGTLCVECLGPLAPAEALLDRCGAALCAPCAGEFYLDCAGCGGLVPKDEAASRHGDALSLFCPECFAKGASPGVSAAPRGDEEVSALVARYLELYRESRRVEEQFEEVKERLKVVARARPRISNAVLLRADGESGVRCSYLFRTSYDAEALGEAERLMGTEEFGALFERKVSYSAIKDSLERFLSAEGDGRDEARGLIRAAARHKEEERINVVESRRKKAKQVISDE